MTPLPFVLIAVSGEEPESFWTELRRLTPAEAAVELVHVIDDAAAHQIGIVAAHLAGHEEIRRPHRQSDEAERHGAVVLLDEAAARLGGRAERGILRGRPGQAIVEQAAASRADLIVVGARASVVDVPADPHSLGHTARFVVDHAPCPVLVVRR